MSGEFNLQTEIRDNTLVLKTEGYIIMLREKKYPRYFPIVSAAYRRVVIDMEKSKVINWTGISYLLEVIEILSERKGK